MKKFYSLFFVLLFFALGLQSCSVFPETFDERLATAYVTNSTVRATTARAIRAGQVSAEQGRNILQITDRVRAVLDASADGDERGLDLAIEILRELERYTK